MEEDGNHLDVNAAAPTDVLPSDAKLIVTPIQNDGNDSLYDDTLNKLNEEAQKENKTVDAFIAYDIQFEKDDKETEPVNGSAKVTLKWTNPVKPEGVQDSDQISVIHLKDDSTVENLTEEKDESKNHAGTETAPDDPLSLTATTIQSDSFSVYAVVWSRDNVSKINVHYVDVNGTEISPADTVDVPQDAGIDAFVKAIDGYTYTSAAINNINVTELKTENGYLYFNDGTNWNQASVTDVYLTYTADPVPEETVEPESTETPVPSDEPEATPQPSDTTEPSEQPQETPEAVQIPETTDVPEETAAPSITPEPSEEKETTVEGHTSDNKYSVTVTYGKDAGLPEGTTVTVKALSEDNDEYENAKNAVAVSKKTDADTLGMTALDITLKDKKGNKVEPKDNSRVKVEINAADLPDTIRSIDIHHIKESSNVITGFFKKTFTGTSDKAEEVKKNITVTDGKAVTDFEVSGFSVFTITWTKDSSTGTRIASVNLHYVDEDGNDLDDPTETPAASIASETNNGIVSVDTWANNESKSRIAGHTFKEARLSDIKGTQVTAMMANGAESGGTTTYSLKYTNSETVPNNKSDKSWKNVPVEETAGNNNSIDVYLIYTQNDHITVHYVDSTGAELRDPAVKYFSDFSDEITFKNGSEVNNNWVPTIRDHTYASAHLGSSLGDTVVSIKGENNQLQVKYKNDDNDYNTVADTDLYLVYDKTTYTKEVDVYYTDIAGIPITDAAGNPLIKKYDAADWTNGTHSFIDDARSFTPDGYAEFSTSNMNVDDIPHWWNDNNNHQDYNNTQNHIVYVTDNVVKRQNANFGGEILRNANGYLFDTMNYSNEHITLRRTGGNGYTTDNTNYTSLSLDQNPNSETSYNVYIMYKKFVKIHDVNSNDNRQELEQRNSTASIGYYGYNKFTTEPWADSNINRYDASAFTDNSTYGTSTRKYVKLSDGTTVNFTKIAWQFDGPKSWDNSGKNTDSDKNNYKWKTRIYTSDNTYTDYDYLISDVYLEYNYKAPLTVTVHHVDSEGNKIAEDTKESLSADKTYTPASDTGYAVTNYKLTSGKYGMSVTDGKATGGTEFSSFTFSKSDDNWTSSYVGTDPGAESQSIDLQNDIWLIYTKKDASTQPDAINPIVHFVDEDGNVLHADRALSLPIYVVDEYKNWNGTSTNDTTTYRPETITGYTYLGTYIGTKKADDSNKIPSGNVPVWKYTNENGSVVWHTGYGAKVNTTSGINVEDSLVSDIYVVYKKGKPDALASDIKIHYVYPVTTEEPVMENYDDNGTNRTRQATDSEGKQLFTTKNSFSEFASGELGANNKTTLENSGSIGSGVAVNVNPYIGDITHESINSGTSTQTTYEYVNSFVSASDRNGTPLYERLTSDAPNITEVRIVDGKTQYLVNLAFDSADNSNGFVNLSRQRSNRWYCSASSGRRFTLRKNGNNFSIIDSNSSGTAIDLNLVSSTDEGNTYTGVSTIDGFTTTYTVQESGNSYQLKVQEWTENEATDIYQVYAPKTENQASVAIENDMVYSGHLVAKVEGLPAGATITSYNWQKNVNNNGFQPVTRTQRGTSWNVEHDINQRTYLDLVADDGALRTTGEDKHTSVVYRLEVTYTDSNGTSHTISTGDTGNGVDFDVPYYDQLENGSFENPKGTYSWSNAAYRAAGGVWQTSGVGQKNNTNRNHLYQDIEIVRTANDNCGDGCKYNNKWKSDYHWQEGEGTDHSTGAKDGSQFAELNAESSGALYQDVITMPNEYLNYWLSHRARGTSGKNNPQYDTMYLVIMPTSLAMTSGTDNGELNDQQELIDFVNKHAKGGYATKTANDIEQEVVCQDYTNGILIVKISSSDLAWHNISVANGYIAKGSLTRFFFMAGPTAADSDGNGIMPSTKTPTMGNFLDAVGFSQRLQAPETPHYHMVIKKTFSGLSDEEVASLASNRASEGKAFKFTVNEYTSNDNGTTLTQRTGTDAYVEYDEKKNSHNSLNGATLSFTANANNTFTLTAETHDGVNLLPRNGSSTGVASEDPYTGDITMTWTLYDNYFPPNSTKYFKVTESNGNVDGYSLSTVNDGKVTHPATATTSETSDSIAQVTGNTTNTITVKDRDVVRVNYSNVYRNNTNDDPNQITVVKKFTGITPAAIEQLTGGSTPYQINVKNPEYNETDNKNDITLVANVQTPVSGDLPDGVTDVELSVSQGEDGSSTYTWTITGTNQDADNWAKAGNYVVKESNFKTGTENPLNSVEINGKSVTLSGQEDSAISNVQVGQSDTEDIVVPKITANDTNPQAITTGWTSGNPIELNENTNLIIARYVEGEESSQTAGYVVLTHGIAGVNLRQAVINFMTTNLGFNTASAETIHFRSGDVSTGDIKIGSNDTDQATINFDSMNHQLILTDANSSTGTRWTGYYATGYTLDSSDKVNEVRITNQYKPAVRLMKISSGDNSTPLKDAEFQLYKYEGSTRKYYQSDGTFGDTAATLKTNGKGIASVEGNEDANSTVNLDPGPGTYYFKETKAPPGYNMPFKNVVAIKVKDNGTVSLITDSNDDSLNQSEKLRLNTVTDQTDKNYVKFDWNSPYYTITIQNTAGFALPRTGGLGILPYLLAGVLTICIAMLLKALKSLREG